MGCVTSGMRIMGSAMTVTTTAIPFYYRLRDHTVTTGQTLTESAARSASCLLFYDFRTCGLQHAQQLICWLISWAFRVHHMGT